MISFEIYLYKKVFLSTDIYKYLLKYASDYAKNNIQRKIAYKEKCMILANDFLLKNLIYKKFKFKYNSDDIITNKFGKPFFKRQNGCCFSSSHNEKYSVIAFGKKDIGADIENIKNIKKESQYLFVSNLDYLDKNNMKLSLCKLWTAKESYCKALGSGLNISPKNIQVTKKRNNLRVTHEGKNQEWFVKHIILFEKAIIAVCAAEQFLINYNEINITEYILDTMSNKNKLNLV